MIKRHAGTINAIVPLTPSKSITNRALIIRALSEQKFDIINQATADDSVLLHRILENLSPEINANDSGTAYRFLTAFLSIQEGEYILTGTERMKQRPIGSLVTALQMLGAEIEYVEKKGFPPLKIKAKNLQGGKISIDASESSQFVSALLMIAPYMKLGLDLEISGEINSRPYILMTISLMKYFGIEVLIDGSRIIIPAQKYFGKKIYIENDWSSASFWYEIAAQAENAEITLKGLKPNSIQGDYEISKIMENFGVTTEYVDENIIIRKNSDYIIPAFFKYDFSSCPDLVIPIAALCTVLKIPAELNGVKNLRIKESDRLAALKTELEKIGATITIEPDIIEIHPPSVIEADGLHFHSHNDHRMVMALAALSMSLDNIEIDDPLPVSKSYPEFWEQFAGAGFKFV